MFKRFLIVLAVAIMTGTYAQAQFNFGVRAGLNLTNMKMSGNDITIEADMKPGIQLGVVGELGIAESFFIQPGILFAQQGCKIGSSKTSLSYIQIPVNAMYKYDVGSVTLLGQAGPYFGFGVAGKQKYDGGSSDVKFGSGDDDDFKAFDCGLGIGAGVQFSSFQAGIGYNFGLANLDPAGSSDYKVRNNGLVFTFTYLFGL